MFNQQGVKCFSIQSIIKLCLLFIKSYMFVMYNEWFSVCGCLCGNSYHCLLQRHHMFSVDEPDAAGVSFQGIFQSASRLKTHWRHLMISIKMQKLKIWKVLFLWIVFHIVEFLFFFSVHFLNTNFCIHFVILDVHTHTYTFMYTYVYIYMVFGLQSLQKYTHQNVFQHILLYFCLLMLVLAFSLPLATFNLSFETLASS